MEGLFLFDGLGVCFFCSCPYLFYLILMYAMQDPMALYVRREANNVSYIHNCSSRY